MTTQAYPMQPSTVRGLQAWLARDKAAWLAPVAMLVSAASLHLYTLMRVPAPFVDEGWNANRAWALLQTGRAFGTLDSGVFERYEGYWTFFPLLSAAIHALSLTVFGLNLFGLRLTSLLFGLALLAAIYVIGNRLAGRWAGLSASALTSLSLPFLLSSHLARHDIIVVAMGFGAIALYVTDRSHTLSIKSVLCGLLVGLTLDVHYNGIIYGPVIVALLLLDYGWGMFRKGRFWGFAVGAACGVAFFVAMHILPYPQTYFALFSLGNGTGRTPPILTADLDVWLGSAGYLLFIIGLRAPLVVAALVVLARTRLHDDKRLLVIFGVLLLTFLAIIRGRPVFYGLLISPAADLLVGALLARVPWGLGRGSLWALGRTALVLGIVGASILITLMPALRTPADDYQATFERIGASVPPGGIVMGPQTYWFALPSHPYFSWEQLIYYRRDTPGSTLKDAFGALRPDYLIIDKHLDGALDNPDTQFLHLPRAELESFLDKQAVLMATVETVAFGDIRIYKIDWTHSGLPELRDN